MSTFETGKEIVVSFRGSKVEGKTYTPSKFSNVMFLTKPDPPPAVLSVEEIGEQVQLNASVKRYGEDTSKGRETHSEGVDC